MSRVPRRCPYARRVTVFSTKFRSSFITRWYCTRAEAWCPYRARRRECPYLPSPAAFYGFGPALPRPGSSGEG